MAFLTQNKAKFWKNDHNIGFWEKCQFFVENWRKSRENCDHNIDPRSPWSQLIRLLDADSNDDGRHQYRHEKPSWTSTPARQARLVLLFWGLSSSSELVLTYLREYSSASSESMPSSELGRFIKLSWGADLHTYVSKSAANVSLVVRLLKHFCVLRKTS
jgi:hypothetical protein